jgi:hypothetical protein
VHHTHFPTCKHSPTYLAMTWCSLQHPTLITDDHNHSTQRTNTAVLHLLSRPKIQPTWRSVLCLLCCRVYDKTTAALCSHPVVASCCTIDGAFLYEFRRMNPCHSYLPECLNSSRTWCRDRPSSTAASCLGNVAYGCHPCHRSCHSDTFFMFFRSASRHMVR